MGVGFFPCDYCGESICDCGSYYQCDNNCGRRWCNKKCAAGDGYERKEGEYLDSCSCKFCRNEDVEDSPLLEYLLKHFNISKDYAKEMYLKGKGNHESLD